jgi:hypothetical protein
VLSKIIIRLSIFAILGLLPAPEVGAEIGIPISPLLQPVVLDGDSNSGFDEFGEENKAETGKAKAAGSKVSKTKAVLLSILVPGAGHYYLDHKGRGQLFIGAEVAAWFGFFAFRTYGSWKEDDYKKYAIQYAGITGSGHDETFYRNMLFYDSREEYNSSGRVINPGAQYYPNEPQYDWFWESSARRQQYRTIRNDSEVAYRKATFMLGLALLNRIVAGIDAYRLAQKESNRIKDDDFLSRHNIDIDFKADPFGSNPDIGITITHRF